MGNNGKSLTNISFRAKILEVIDKLKDQNKTALVRHVDDFEALNKDTFEAGMNALVDAIPAGGTSGDDSGTGGYVVTFGLDFENGGVTCDKTIDDIIAHADNHIVGRFVLKDYPLEGEATVDIYCDNLKFDYQQLHSDNPEIAPTIPEYTYLGFFGDGIVLSVAEGELLGNSPLDGEETLYCKTYVTIYYVFDDENPHWEFNEISIEQPEIETEKIDFPYDDYTVHFVNTWNVDLLDTPDSNGGNAETYSGAGIRGEQYFLNYFMPPNLMSGGANRTSLYSPAINDANGNQLAMYSKAAQVEVRLRDHDSIFNAIFTINKCSIGHNEVVNGNIVHGYVEMFCDEVDNDNDRIIRHFIRIEVIGNPVTRDYTPKTTYKKMFISYTTT